MRRTRTVALPRPKGTRATSRVNLTISMHPSRLAELETRAAAVSMSLTAYVDALLASDGADVEPRIRNRKINWLEDNSGATFARRCGGTHDLTTPRVLSSPCVLPAGHEGPCAEHGPLRPGVSS